MINFIDYAAKMRQQKTPFTGGAQQIDPAVVATGGMAGGTTPSGQQQIIVPTVDTSNAIGSLAQLLGPTPAEREAQERRAMEGKAQMAAWTGLFDGLRQLGNLYYTTKGATPQRYDNPYQQIEQQYQQQRQLANEQNAYQRQYYNSIYALQRQASAEKRQNMLAEAQAKWYDTRDAAAQQKADSDAEKAKAQVNATNARAEQIRARTKQLEELHPLQKQKLQSVIKKYIHDANRPYSTGRGGGGSKGSGNDPYEELATHLQDNPDTVGPILQSEGLGFYDPQTKEFTFTKNVTKGMATTGNKRTRQQLSSRGSAQITNKQKSGKKNRLGL